METTAAQGVWLKARQSNNGGGGCVEFMITDDGVCVRDTKQHGEGLELRFTTSEWLAFIAGARDEDWVPSRA